MKSLFALGVSAFMMVASFAQSTPTSVKYNKATRPALILLVPYSEDIAEGTIIQKLNEIGYNPETKGALFWKKNTVDGYYVFKNVTLRNLNGQSVDLYFKVNRKSRKEEDQSYINMLVSRGEDRFVSSESDPLIFESATQFLNGFMSHSASFKLNMDIQTQQSSLKSAEAKYVRLQEQDSTLTKKIRELEETLKNNRLSQEAQLKVIEGEKRKLETLKPKNQNAQ
jgi:hypothetical protein